MPGHRCTVQCARFDLLAVLLAERIALSSWHLLARFQYFPNRLQQITAVASP